jgi:D-alanyl-D-alanine carboxypeptidase
MREVVEQRMKIFVIRWCRLFPALAFLALAGFSLPVRAAGDSDPAESEDSSLYLNGFSLLKTPYPYCPDRSVDYDGTGIKAGLLYDVETRKIVWQKEMNKSLPIASLTKMMVGLITVEEVRMGNLHWDDQVSWTRSIVMGRKKKRHVVNVPANYSLYDLFKSAMIASNNEAAEQMARFAGKGDLPAFIERMNRRALELGMNSTYYSNPTGLPNSVHSLDNSSSPVDLLTLALEMLNYPEILEVTGMGYANVQNGRHTQELRNHNRLTIEYEGEVDGMKTGYTRRAGFCLVATSNKCDYRLISVALGSTAPGTRNDIVRDLINQYYTSVGMDRLGPNGHPPADMLAGTTKAPADPNAKYIYKTRQARANHTVRRGEYLARIAEQYKCSVTDLKRWNHMRSTRIIPGQKLTVYTAVTEKIYIQNPVTPETLASDDDSDDPDDSRTAEETETAPAPATAKVAAPAATIPAGSPSDASYILYTVQSGDTLYDISKRYDGITVQMLKTVNHIRDSRNLKAGTRIKVPVTGS